MISPHGGTLVSRVVSASERDAMQAYARTLPVIDMNAREASDLLLIAIGAMSPLEGFMGRAAYESVLEHMRLPSGVVWSLPVTLGVSDAAVARRATPFAAALRTPTRPSPELFRWKRCIARTRLVRQRLRWGPAMRRTRACSTSSPPVTPMPADRSGRARPVKAGPFASRELEPAETRALSRRRAGHRVCAFQTRNPIHRAHEYLIKCALEMMDGFLIHPPWARPSPTTCPPTPAWTATWRSWTTTSRRDHVVLARVPVRDALRRPARSDLPRADPQELRLHALHRRPRPRRRRQLLRHLRRAARFSGVRAGRDRRSRPSCSSTRSSADAAAAWPRRRPAPTAPRIGSTLSGTQVREMLAEGRDRARSSSPVPRSRPFCTSTTRRAAWDATWRRRLVVIGLDCVTPELVFGPWLDEMPNVRRLMRDGLHGRLTSTFPPITVPAWMAMMTSQDPGMLGIYGFRNRGSFAYDDTFTVNAAHVQARRCGTFSRATGCAPWSWACRSRIRPSRSTASSSAAF